PTTLRAVAPAGSGAAHVSVTSAGGTSSATAADVFTYVAAPTVTGLSTSAGPGSGGTTVKITGSGFTAANMAVRFGSATASAVVVSDTQVTSSAPAGTGTVDVTV